MSRRTIDSGPDGTRCHRIAPDSRSPAHGRRSPGRTRPSQRCHCQLPVPTSRPRPPAPAASDGRPTANLLHGDQYLPRPDPAAPRSNTVARRPRLHLIVETLTLHHLAGLPLDTSAPGFHYHPPSSIMSTSMSPTRLSLPGLTRGRSPSLIPPRCPPCPPRRKTPLRRQLAAPHQPPWSVGRPNDAQPCPALGPPQPMPCTPPPAGPTTDPPTGPLDHDGQPPRTR